MHAKKRGALDTSELFLLPQPIRAIGTYTGSAHTSELARPPGVVTKTYIRGVRD